MPQATNTILFTTRYGRVHSLAYDPRRTLYLVTATTLVLFGAILYSGFHLGVNLEARRQLAEIADLRLLTSEHQRQINHNRNAADDHLDALALRLGRMQAQLMRLDALGDRLVTQADLDASEFDFSIAPPVGGPQEGTALSATAVPDFLGMLDELEQAVTDRTEKLDVLEQLIMNRNLRQRIMPSGTAVEKGLLSSKYGKRIDPFTGKMEQHKGIDIAGKEGSDVLATGDGVVIWADPRSGYGNLVEIDHGKGIITRYGHNKTLLVGVGDTVRKGQPVALMGSTGRSTGPHVHIEVLRDGKQVNPAQYLSSK
jgi:murein DD-endopeptidase MepM/ murein hydrolase activator NlpD